MNKYYLDGEVLVVVTPATEGRTAQIRRVHPILEEGNIDEDVVLEDDQDNEDAPPASTRRKYKKRSCKNCGKPGHLAKTCPESQRETESDDIEDAPKIPPGVDAEEILREAGISGSREQDLVYDIRSKFVIQKLPVPTVLNSLEITMKIFLALCKKHDIHR